MRNFCFTFRSLMQAQHASIVLMQKGILSEYGKIPAFMSSSGCSHGVYVDRTDAPQAAHVFQQEGVSFIRGVHVSEYSRNAL